MSLSCHSSSRYIFNSFFFRFSFSISNTNHFLGTDLIRTINFIFDIWMSCPLTYQQISQTIRVTNLIRIFLSLHYTQTLRIRRSVKIVPGLWKSVRKGAIVVGLFLRAFPSVAHPAYCMSKYTRVFSSY